MAAGYRYGGTLSKRRARRGYRVPMSEINVTPMVDVMLVLLIIFMVTAPLLTVGVDVDANATLPDVALPETEAGPVTAGEGLSITVDAGGRIFLQDSEIPFEELVPKLTALTETFGTGQVFVRGDQAASYGEVAKVLVRIKEAGLPVTLVTEQLGRP